jgi:hypothetical protein
VVCLTKGQGKEVLMGPKALICRHLGRVQHGLRDKHLITQICLETGWPKPNKKNREMFFWRYYREACKQLPPKEVYEKALVVNKQAFYRSGRWIALRYEVLKKHGGKCQCCGASPRDGAILHVDHVKPRSKFPELALCLENLQVLCSDCNLGKSNTDSTDWRSACAA